MGGMFGGDGDKSHLVMGMLLGQRARENNREAYITKLEKLLDETKAIMDGHAADSITKGADRDAWRELALNMVAEIQNPSLPRRYSAPEADAARAQLLQTVHRQSYEETVRRAALSGVDQYVPQAIAEAKVLSVKTVRGYPADLLASKGSKDQRDNKPTPD